MGGAEFPPLALFDFFFRSSNCAFFTLHSICIPHPIKPQVFVLAAQLIPHPEGAGGRKRSRGGRVGDGKGWGGGGGGGLCRREISALTPADRGNRWKQHRRCAARVSLQPGTRLESSTFQSDAVSLGCFPVETKKVLHGDLVTPPPCFLVQPTFGPSSSRKKMIRGLFPSLFATLFLLPQ